MIKLPLEDGIITFHHDFGADQIVGWSSEAASPLITSADAAGIGVH